MAYNSISCKCGAEIEVFITVSVDGGGRETCDICGRVAEYASPKNENSVTDLTFTREIGEVSR